MLLRTVCTYRYGSKTSKTRKSPFPVRENAYFDPRSAASIFTHGEYTAAVGTPSAWVEPGIITAVNMKHRHGLIAIRTLVCSAGLLASSFVQTNDAAESPTRGYGKRRSGGVHDGGASTDHSPQVAGDCRVAVCISGHIRSFVYPVVHRSIRTNLVEAIEKEGGCKVDVFAYATPSDVVASYKLVCRYTRVEATVETDDGKFHLQNAAAISQPSIHVDPGCYGLLQMPSYSSHQSWRL